MGLGKPLIVSRLLRLSLLSAALGHIVYPLYAEDLPPIIGQGARALPVIAKHGMVVAQEGTAARVGLEILKKGGNAIDAAVVTALALAVTLPRAGNLGGGGFMLVHLAKQKKTDGDRLSRGRAGGDAGDRRSSMTKAMPSRVCRAIPASPSACPALSQASRWR